MATINIGSENASDVFYRCGRLCCGVEKRRTEREKDDKERVKCSPVFFFFALLFRRRRRSGDGGRRKRASKKNIKSKQPHLFFRATLLFFLSLSLNLNLHTTGTRCRASRPG